MEVENKIILDRDSFLLVKKGAYELPTGVAFFIPLVVISELYFAAGRIDISIFKINESLKGIQILELSNETALIYSDIRKHYSRKERSGNSIYRDNLYYLASLAIEYGYNLIVSKRNYNALKSYHHDDLVLVKVE